MKDKILEGYYKSTRTEMLKYIPDTAKVILDVGCGEGNFGRELKNGNNVVWGIEVEEGPAAVAAKHLDKVLTGTVEAMIDQLPDNYFDTIIFNDVLEHLLQPEIVLGKIKKKLTAGGCIVCSIPNVRHWKNLRKLVFKKDWKYEENGIMDKTHFRFFTYKSIQRMFTELGFDIIKLEGINGSKSIRFVFFNALLLFSAGDTKYLQFACVVKP
jgi:2-polyprenyl-3-methyl-5-hydroxy-6-metoxy-1,4-benzoquinol methylase